MKQPQACDELLDRLTREESLSPDLLRHIASCPGCRMMRENLEAARSVQTLYPGGAPGQVKAALVEKCFPEKTPDLIPETSFGESLFRFRWSPVFALVALVLALSLATSISRHGAVFQPTEETYLVALDGGAQLKRPVREPLTMARGKAQALLPDGTVLQIQGPAKLRFFSRGFEMTEGTLTASVAVDSTTFRILTPSGDIEVLGTVFTVTVDLTGTLVNVISGRVKILPKNEKPSVLIANGSGRMVNYKEPPQEKENQSSAHDELYKQK